MASWFSLALALIRIADGIIGWLREKGQLDAGRDAEVAKASAAILAKSAFAKGVLVDLTKADEKQVDDLLKELEK